MMVRGGGGGEGDGTRTVAQCDMQQLSSAQGEREQVAGARGVVLDK